jgi:hypothetical protein
MSIVECQYTDIKADEGLEKSQRTQLTILYTPIWGGKKSSECTELNVTKFLCGD